MDKYYCFFPVRDGVEHIEEVMDSLINQSVPPSLIIVVDDGSTDGTSEILEQYKTKHSKLIEIIRTENKTRDYKRLPELWNVSLKEGYEYHMIGAGDVSYEKDYAKKILEYMDNDHEIVMASGDYEPFTAQSPHGAGRFVRQDFFYNCYKDNKYPLTIGYESEILVRAMMKNKKSKIYNDVIFNHLDELGHGHNFSEFGYSMRALGYHPLWCFSRCLIDIKRLGFKGAFGMFKSYVTYKPEKTGYYSLFDEDVRKFMKNYQSVTFRLVIFNAIINTVLLRQRGSERLRDKLRKMGLNYKKKHLAKHGIIINED